MPLCSQCGSPCETEANFCSNCGLPVDPLQERAIKPDSTHKYFFLACFLLAELFIVLNVGGELAGLQPIEAFLRLGNYRHFSIDFEFTHILLAISHLIGLFFCITGIISTLNKSFNATFHAIFLEIAGILGIVSARVEYLNCLAEILVVIIGIVVLVVDIFFAPKEINYDFPDYKSTNNPLL